MSALLRGLPALALALGGGVVWGLQFGRQGFLVAPWLALAPLPMLLGRRRGVPLAFAHGLAAWLTAIPWIAPTLETYGGLGRPLAIGALLLLAAYLGAYHAAFAWLGRPLWRAAVGTGGWRGRPLAGGALALAGLPALWSSLEWVRGHLFSGFPWNLAAYAWVEVPGALPATAWIGAYGLSAVVAFAGTGTALAAARRRWEPLALAALLPLLLLAVAGRWGSGPPPPPPRQPVRIVQPNVANQVGWDPARAARDLDELLALSRRACDREGALLLWPESAAWPYSYDREPAFRARVDELAARCPVVLNSARRDAEGRWYNSAYLVAPAATGGGPARYDKRHLVPFGEYVPLSGLLPFVDSLARNAGDFTAAREVRLLPWGREAIGLAICFEVIFPEETAEAVREGATVLATITNDAWYGDTWAPWQHFRAARFRAAESRRPMLRAAITGVSGVIGADGSVRGRLGVGERGVLRAMVSGRRAPSPYSRLPWLVPLLAGLIAASAILLSRPRAVQ